jgi:diacylglycerol kinase (ATP)
MSKKDKFIRVKLIVNLGAGNASEVTKNLTLVTGYLKKNGLKADVARAKPKAKATPLAKQAVKDGFKIVIAMGGDGTVEAVMRGMVCRKARLGILPVGVENNIAKSLGIPLNLEEACDLIASDDTRKVDVGQVKTSKGKRFSFFEMACVGLSSAMYPAGTKAVDGELSGIQAVAPAPIQEETKAVGGELSGIQAAAQTLIQEEDKSKVFLNLDDESIVAVETMLVMVSNTPVFGKKFLVAPNASMQNGLLDISVFQDFSKAELLGYYAKMLEGSYSGNGKVQRYQARKLKVKSSPKLKVMADGIELGKGTVTIKMRPGVLRVIAAKKNLGTESLAKDKGIPAPVQDGEEKMPVPVSPTVKKTIVRKKEISEQ